MQLVDGASILPYEQDELREASEQRHTDAAVGDTESISSTHLSALPRTIAWSHPGTYFGEAAVVLLDDNRVHVKAGQYQLGWASVTLNQRPLPISGTPVVIGQGANTTSIYRVTDHILTVRTATLQLTLVSSDHFLNIERVHLEKGYNAKTQLGGILGGTAKASWVWHPSVESDNTVASSDLFDGVQMTM